MIDYTAAGFTLLQGAHWYAPEIGEFAMSSSLTAKLSPLPAISLLTLYRTARLSISAGRSSAQVLFDQHVHLIGGGGEAGPRRARRKWR